MTIVYEFCVNIIIIPFTTCLFFSLFASHSLRSCKLHVCKIVGNILLETGMNTTRAPAMAHTALCKPLTPECFRFLSFLVSYSYHLHFFTLHRHFFAPLYPLACLHNSAVSLSGCSLLKFDL